MTHKLLTKYSLPPDALLARHAIFRKDCDEPKERLQGRLDKVLTGN